eukprot:CAMPEP_0195526870 /NCGR_PEP_ID=MMETSP0794_2-20130614/28179_1 /TAXON_ID=515487 /ORGANISM="Stephanopyxis turris, Strain CCMP 815" /LENGTH=212 /DNA_ID=CAMNT_0040657655 /DNA_START=54 /DNA_END=692 /DNA_ORIENTATION=+
MKLLAAFALPALAAATVGVDVSASFSAADFKCLEEPGGHGPVKFAIVRAYQSGGQVDPNAKATIQAALDAGVSHVDAYLFPDVHGDPAAQVRDTHSALSGVRYGMIWYDIERLSWSSSQATNQDFIKKLVDEGKSLGVHAGIYTNYYNWQDIVGLDWDYPHKEGLPLWYAHYDNSPSFSDFKAFGGWTSPSIKQYAGDVTTCGKDVDFNWYP